MPARLFTPRFFIMFGYSFTVFVSVFQLLPAAPYRILDLGGSTAVAGLFHGMLTYSSAMSAPFTGRITDRIGHRPVLIAVSLALAVFSASYAFIDNYKVMLGVVFLHGLIWSALLSASGAYMTATIPPHRRAEGLSYWGMATVLAIGAAPALGFWVYHKGWTVLCFELAILNLIMAAIAWYLPDDRDLAGEVTSRALNAPPVGRHPSPLSSTNPDLPVMDRPGIEWRVLVLSGAMTLISFGYGSLTSFSALFADELGLSPRSLFLSAMALAILAGRLTVGRALDRLGYRRALLPVFVVPAVGLILLALAEHRALFLIAAVVYGAGFGIVHPAFTAYVIGHVSPGRRGAAFGAMLAAFDTGIGSGASLMGWMVHTHGFRMAFSVAAMVAALALPYFLLAERRLGFRQVPAMV